MTLEPCWAPSANAPGFPCLPYKGALELWYQDNISFLTDLKIIFLTAWQIIFPHSNLVYRVFKNLPPKPEELALEKEKGAVVEIAS